MEEEIRDLSLLTNNLYLFWKERIGDFALSNFPFDPVEPYLSAAKVPLITEPGMREILGAKYQLLEGRIPAWQNRGEAVVWMQANTMARPGLGDDLALVQIATSQMISAALALRTTIGIDYGIGRTGYFGYLDPVYWERVIQEMKSGR